MEFADYLRAARKRKSLTQAHVAEAMGVERAMVSQWENGAMPDPRKLPALAQLLGVKIGALFGEEPGSPLPTEVREPTAGYPLPPAGTHYPPVIGTAQLGDDGHWYELNYPTGHGDGFVMYPSRDPGAYALRCKGDSMRPRIKHGEFVSVEPSQPISPGDEVVIRDKSDRVMVKIFNFERDGMVEVSSVNSKHQPFTIPREEIEVIHYVAGILKPSMYYADMFQP